MNVTFNDLINNVKKYNLEEDSLKLIEKAYDYASYFHNGQKRQSGEDYITHPLNVAYILSNMHADSDTICASLLHDTLEHTKITKEEIACEFNETIADLVDGVTKISKLNFSSKEEQNLANTRKIITGMMSDVRIIIIKLADRLHNMRTLEYKSSFKQKENSLETMEIFVPLAYYIGQYRIKSELEDISFSYLKPDNYKRILEVKNKLEIENYPYLEEMSDKIKELLKEKEIINEIKIRTKNIYGIYKRMKETDNIHKVHDLFALKIMIDEIDNCYRTLGAIHSLYHPINNKFKDYISNPKTNLYQSLHTTVFGPNNKLVQAQIRTFDMDKIASNGITEYWYINKGYSREKIQDFLKTKFQFYNSLKEIDSMFSDNKEFISQVKTELLANTIYVYNSNGEIIELPEKSTIIDYAYKLGSDIASHMVTAYVNNEKVEFNYELKNKDRVLVITDDLVSSVTEDWENIAKTSHAKKLIKNFINNDK